MDKTDIQKLNEKYGLDHNLVALLEKTSDPSTLQLLINQIEETIKTELIKKKTLMSAKTRLQTLIRQARNAAKETKGVSVKSLKRKSTFTIIVN